MVRKYVFRINKKNLVWGVILGRIMAAIFFIMHPSSVPGKHPQLYFKKERRSARKMKLCPLGWWILKIVLYMLLFWKLTRILREDVTIRQERKRDRKKKKRRRPEVGDCPLSVVVGLGRTCSKNGRILWILSKNNHAFFHPKWLRHVFNN